MFSIFLQFYLERQIDDARQLRSEKEQLTAELMVSVALKTDLKSQGQIHFDSGDLSYNLLTDSSASSKITDHSSDEKTYQFSIHLKDGTSFQIKN